MEPTMKPSKLKKFFNIFNLPLAKNKQNYTEISEERFRKEYLKEKERISHEFETQDESSRLEQIAEKNKITSHLSKLLEIKDYSKITNLLDKFYHDVDNFVDTSFYSKCIYQIPDLFLNDKTCSDINFLKFMNHPIIIKGMKEAFNAEYDSIVNPVDYGFISPLAKFKSHFLKRFDDMTSPSIYSNTTQKLFNIDVQNNTLEYLGQSHLSPEEKLLLNISFRNIKENLDSPNSQPTKDNESDATFLFADSLALIAFIKEHPEYEGHPLFQKKSLKPYFSNFSIENIMPNNGSTIQEAKNFITPFIVQLLEKPYFDKAHENILSELNNKYGNKIESLLNQVDFPIELKDKISSQYNDFEKHKKTLSTETDIEVLNLINKTQKTLIDSIELYKDLSSMHIENNASIQLINTITKHVDKFISESSEANINAVQKDNQLKKAKIKMK